MFELGLVEVDDCAVVIRNEAIDLVVEISVTLLLRDLPQDTGI